MNAKDMVVGVVYESANGLLPYEISEAIEKKYKTLVTTREIQAVLKKNSRLFIEENGRIKSPSYE